MNYHIAIKSLDGVHILNLFQLHINQNDFFISGDHIFYALKI